MPYALSLPTNNSLASTAEMRGQLQALHGDIQSRAAQAELGAQIAGTPHNCATVRSFAEQGINSSDFEKQQLAPKLDEPMVIMQRN